MSDLIDKEVLYNHFANLEAIALEQVMKHMYDKDLTKWRIWSAIQQDRIAYKNDVFDAPVVDAEPVVRCKDCKKWETINCPFARDFVRWDGFKFCAWGERKEG